MFNGCGEHAHACVVSLVFAFLLLKFFPIIFLKTIGGGTANTHPNFSTTLTGSLSGYLRMDLFYFCSVKYDQHGAIIQSCYEITSFIEGICQRWYIHLVSQGAALHWMIGPGPTLLPIVQWPPSHHRRGRYWTHNFLPCGLRWCHICFESSEGFMPLWFCNLLQWDLMHCASCPLSRATTTA